MVSFSNLTDMLTGRGCVHAEGLRIDPYWFFLNCPLLHAIIAIVGIMGLMELKD